VPTFGYASVAGRETIASIAGIRSLVATLSSTATIAFLSRLAAVRHSRTWLGLVRRV